MIQYSANNRQYIQQNLQTGVVALRNFSEKSTFNHNPRIVIKKYAPTPAAVNHDRYWKLITKDEDIDFYKRLYGNHKSFFTKTFKNRRGRRRQYLHFSAVLYLDSEKFYYCSGIDHVKICKSRTSFISAAQLKNKFQNEYTILLYTSVIILNRNFYLTEEIMMTYEQLTSSYIIKDIFYNLIDIIIIANNSNFLESIKIKYNFMFKLNLAKTLRNRSTIRHSKNERIIKSSIEIINYPLTVLISSGKSNFVRKLTSTQQCYNDMNYFSMLNKSKVDIPLQISQNNSYYSSLNTSSKETLDTLQIAHEVDLIMQMDRVVVNNDSGNEVKFKKTKMKSMKDYFHITLSSTPSTTSSDETDNTMESLTSLNDESVLHSSMMVNELSIESFTKFNPFNMESTDDETNENQKNVSTNKIGTSLIKDDALLNIEHFTIEHQMINRFRKSHILVTNPVVLLDDDDDGDDDDDDDDNNNFDIPTKPSETKVDANIDNKELFIFSDKFIDSLFLEAIEIIKSEKSIIRVPSQANATFFTDEVLSDKVDDVLTKTASYFVTILKTFKEKTIEFGKLLSIYFDRLVYSFIVTITGQSLTDIGRKHSIENVDQTTYKTAHDCTVQHDSYFTKMWNPTNNIKSKPNNPIEYRSFQFNNFNDFIENNLCTRNVLTHIKYLIINLNYQKHSINNLSRKIQYSRGLILRFVKILSSSVNSIKFVSKDVQELLKFVNFVSANYKMLNNEKMANGKTAISSNNTSTKESSHNIIDFQETYSETGRLLNSSRLFTVNIQKLMQHGINNAQFFKYLLNTISRNMSSTIRKLDTDSSSLITDIEFHMSPNSNMIASREYTRNLCKNYGNENKRTNISSQFKCENNSNSNKEKRRRKRPSEEKKESPLKELERKRNRDTMAGIPSIYDSEIIIPTSTRICLNLKYLCTCCCCCKESFVQSSN